MPSSPALTVDFGQGKANPGPPLSSGFSDFKYTNESCPSPGTYTIVNMQTCFRPDTLASDAGHIFYGAHPLPSDSGYMMLVNYQASAVSKIILSDTVKNLCNGSSYLFWAGIDNLSLSVCFYPNLSFNIETLSGEIIQSFQTGDVGGNTDKGAPYFGQTGFDPKTTFPAYYGGIFVLPAGINDVVLKIVTNPTNNLPCTNTIALDNILLSAVGPTVSIANPENDGWVIGSCFNGSKPVVLNGNIGTNYYSFDASPYTVNSSLTNPAVQWQQSNDNGFTWADIPGENNLTLSHIFSQPDTFFLRLRASESININNPNCSIISNVIQVQVDGLPKNFDITSNSPVCTDSDIVFNVSGGATYLITGPNGYSDNTSFPHVYHPTHNDSGWYKVSITTFGGCQVTDSTFVQVIGPDLKVKASLDSLCYGSKTQLEASGGKIYLWSPAEGLSNANIANPVATPLTTTTYNIKVSDNSGCSAFGSVKITLLDSLVKASISGPSIICPNDVALFKDTSTGKIMNWNWNFGNGNTSNNKNPLPQHYTFSESNRLYPVQLIVNDSSGCADTTAMFIKAVNNCYIAVPTAFTPNHDGLNDYLYPLNAYKATNLNFRVFNRFGKIIFETNNWTKKWDGTIANMPQPQGTYVWTLDYTDENNQHISLKGTTVLIR